MHSFTGWATGFDAEDRERSQGSFLKEGEDISALQLIRHHYDDSLTIAKDISFKSNAIKLTQS